MSVLSIAASALALFAGLIALGIVAGLFFLLWKVVKLVLRLLGRVLRFVKDEAVDTVHTVGAAVTAGATLPLALGNLVILRLSAARHYARAFGDELKGVGVGVWRVALGNPLRFVGLGALVDGVERRLPDAIERAPRARRARHATFDGYDVIGTLPSGGSGAQLFVARPKASAHRRLLRAGRSLPSEVVIKSFALEAGSTLPQIVRESRALEAASRLGLVCEHQLADDHFYYVMPYVKGEDLERVIRALHARGTADGLADPELRLALGYAVDLCDGLQRFHSGGLWHKDIKPANVIVASGRAHLVDFGLVTPLASALTLTTHGTEYYRDPEMVRLAMQGVKVHEVDGVRFDVYSAGAVLYSLLENCFPAHGSLSRLTKRAPEALKWIVQRAMAEMGSRYPSAAEMRADLAALAAAPDPFALRPADLPSFQRAEARSPVASAPAFAPPSFSAPSYSPPPFMPPAARPAAFETPRAPSEFGRRRRWRRPVGLAAAGVVGLFLTASAAAFIGHEAREESRVAYREQPVVFEPAPRAWPSLSPRERKVLDLAQGVAEDLGGEEEAQPAPAGPSEAPTGAGDEHAGSDAEPLVPALAEHPLPPRGRVLVLDDLTTQVDARVLALLREKLLARGFRVVGEAGGMDDATAEGATVELLAGARVALGLGRADEAETQANLQHFLDQQSELDALILVSRTGDEQEHLYRVLARKARAEAAHQ
ncbi:MAG: hypothetical protein EXS08_02185 [Planctomycetes bacterium]|nr:hypothetical protein [Planctomycetota bacterium]